ncbi:hypothetical protein [Fontivita pretiosa]|uniref:hypothetical protein n=1 Tax=Fontivita pretiosa TaxID=2989684 RepID=UPI003D1695D2
MSWSIYCSIGTFVVCSIVLGGQAPAPEPGPATAPPTAPAGAEEPATVVSAFRGMAMYPADRMRILLDQTYDAIDPKARAELTRLLDEYKRKVDAAAEELGRNPPNQFVLTNRAQIEFAENFEMDVLDPWLEANPRAKQALESAELALDDIDYALGEDREQLLAAATRAGLPREKLAEAKRTIEQAAADRVAFLEGIARLQKSLGRVPKDDPRTFQGMTLLSDVELKRLRVAATIRAKLRELLPMDRRDMLDEELAKMGAPGKS